MENPIERYCGITKLDTLLLDSSKWYIDGVPVTASAADLNSQRNECYVISPSSDLTEGSPLGITGFDAVNNCYKVAEASSSGRQCQLFAPKDVPMGVVFSASPTYTGIGNALDCSDSTIGDPVYLSLDGTLSLAKPSAGNEFVQIVGRVASLSNPGTLILNASFQEIPEICCFQIVPTAFSGLDIVPPDLGNDKFLRANTTNTIKMSSFIADLAGPGLSVVNNQLVVGSANIYNTPGTSIVLSKNDIISSTNGVQLISMGSLSVDAVLVRAEFSFASSSNFNISIVVETFDGWEEHSISEPFSMDSDGELIVCRPGLTCSVLGSSTPNVYAGNDISLFLEQVGTVSMSAKLIFEVV